MGVLNIPLGMNKVSIYQTVHLVEGGVQGYIPYGKMCAITPKVSNKCISLHLAEVKERKKKNCENRELHS